MSEHTVEQGEHISDIAERYGFLSYETIWNDAGNSDLKAERDNPNVLFPGDVVQIPEKKVKTEARPTSNVHVFQIAQDALELRIVIKDFLDEPIAATDCTIEVEGKPEKKKTDADGLVQTKIVRTAKHGTLSILGQDVEVRIGDLDPVTKPSGQIARLNNLGYMAGEIEAPDDDLLQSAVEEFQCDQKLKVDGVCGSNTQAKLKEVHGC